MGRYAALSRLAPETWNGAGNAPAIKKELQTLPFLKTQLTSSISMRIDPISFVSAFRTIKAMLGKDSVQEKTTCIRFRTRKGYAGYKIPYKKRLCWV
ncbi:hypothetical protein CEXT_308611 [Caerostris extrusa]|uniref:Uncharacterized protein n=1 Tax=Caerostris extrusa TaxID=172846 RepID=A0AAV4XPG5_CAEEX|nr:hypothetical protein CEXT_308611 [Caerostris extrusa]